MRGSAISAAPRLGLLGSALICVSLASPFCAQAASPIRFSGQLVGFVTDIAGKPQPGAVVVLLNQQNEFLQKSATDSLGTFAFG
jgi:hypothetical protein